MAGGLGMDDRCRHWRFRAHHHTRAAPAHKRLVRALLGYLSVSIDSVAGRKKSGNHAVGLDSFCHCLCYYHARPPGLEDRRARHIPDRPVTMLERRLLLISGARPNTPAISSSHWQLESRPLLHPRYGDEPSRAGASEIQCCRCWPSIARRCTPRIEPHRRLRPLERGQNN